MTTTRPGTSQRPLTRHTAEAVDTLGAVLRASVNHYDPADLVELVAAIAPIGWRLDQLVDQVKRQAIHLYQQGDLHPTESGGDVHGQVLDATRTADQIRTALRETQQLWEQLQTQLAAIDHDSEVDQRLAG